MAVALLLFVASRGHAVPYSSSSTTTTVLEPAGIKVIFLVRESCTPCTRYNMYLLIVTRYLVVTTAVPGK